MEKLGYSPKEVAQALSLHITTVRRLIAANKLPVVRFGARCVIPAKALAEYLEAHQQNNPTGAGGGR